MADSTRNREELISSFASKLFSAMLGEVVMDAALQSHKDIVRGKAVCQVCGTRCGSVHAQGAQSNGAGPSTGGPSASLPPPDSPAPAGKTVAGTSTPNAKDKSDGNIYFECTNCQKKIASNRYAPHLSGCLGIGTGSRRGAARNAAAKNKLGAEVERSGSPLMGSDYGSPSHEVVNGKGKGKAKNGKKINGKAIDPELNGNHKRPGTPDGPPPKKSKKQKSSTADSDMAMFVADQRNSKKPHIPTATKIPAKLGGSPFGPGSPSAGSGSQYSSRESPSASASGSSFNAQSPNASRGSKPPRTYKSGGPSKKRGRPPGSGKNQLAAAEAAAVRRKTEEKEEDPDFIDVDGEDHEEVSSDSS